MKVWVLAVMEPDDPEPSVSLHPTEKEAIESLRKRAEMNDDTVDLTDDSLIDFLIEQEDWSLTVTELEVPERVGNPADASVFGHGRTTEFKPGTVVLGHGSALAEKVQARMFLQSVIQWTQDGETWFTAGPATSDTFVPA